MRTIVFFLIGMVLIGGCIQPQEPKNHSILRTDAIDLSGMKGDKFMFARYYMLEPLNITLKSPQYNLPLETGEIYNFKDFSRKISLNDEELILLKKNGFVIVRNPFNPKEESITNPYKTLKNEEIPIFITSDSLLHLYHIQFDETLRQIEEKEFYDEIWEISMKLFNESVENYNTYDGDLKEASRRNVAYFSVGLSLLKSKGNNERYNFSIPSFVREEVEAELNLIENHRGFAESPIFKYKEDYSQYVPRGHYTYSEKLKSYFKTFMWYGRMSFLLKEGLVSEEDARLQTMSASLIASEFLRNKELMEKWERIYGVTAFYVGFSDDLGPYEYMETLNCVFGGSFDPDDLTEENIGRLKAKLAEYRSPKIYGGTGDCGIEPPFTPEQADECLEKTKGFRLMGQRFIPDSYFFQNLVFPKVGKYLGEKKPFTLWGEMRVFPRGLDVMALLGSEHARKLLDELEDSNYERYDEQYLKLEEELDGFDESEWNKNLYWSWLFTLKPLLKNFGDGYPTFMQTEEWKEKELNTALASWTELRHDTILYAKQSYTMRATATIPEKSVIGYVEPVPEFYNRLLALTRMTNKGLTEMGVLDDSARHRLKNLEEILKQLIEISKKELEGKELEENYEFIKNFGEELNGVIADVEEKSKKTTIVADVHTDTNTGMVLEEGVGYVDLIVVAYKVPDGRILIGSGPVMSYYEFKHPMDDRLTDEKWREMLRDNPPDRPEWMQIIS
ncbi:MAG: DUF3160 domain-containing protein [Candidatus Syntropharchaeia archaeon]